MRCVDAIKAARTGKISDGKIFVTAGGARGAHPHRRAGRLSGLNHADQIVAQPGWW